MCFGGGGSPTPEPRQEVREETKQAKKEEEEVKIKNRQEALEKEVETSAPVKTSLFYDTGKLFVSTLKMSMMIVMNLLCLCEKHLNLRP